MIRIFLNILSSKLKTGIWPGNRSHDLVKFLSWDVHNKMSFTSDSYPPRAQLSLNTSQESIMSPTIQWTNIPLIRIFSLIYRILRDRAFRSREVPEKYHAQRPPPYPHSPMRGVSNIPSVTVGTEVLIANISVLLMELTLMLLLSHSEHCMVPLPIVLLPTLWDAGWNHERNAIFLFCFRMLTCGYS